MKEIQLSPECKIQICLTETSLGFYKEGKTMKVCQVKKIGEIKLSMKKSMKRWCKNIFLQTGYKYFFLLTGKHAQGR